MTVPDPDRPEPPTARLRRQIGGLAQTLAAEHFPRGDLAALRRMDPERIDAPAFWRLASHHGLLDTGPGPGSPGPASHDRENRWAAIIRGIALCTPTTGRGSAHDPTTRLGRALFREGFSEQRLSRLLTAPSERLRDTVDRTARFLAAKNQPFDWTEPAALILAEGIAPEWAESVRRQIARAYYDAEAQAETASAADLASASS